MNKKLFSAFFFAVCCLLSAVCSLGQGTPGTVRFPTQLDTPDSLFRIKDAARTTLASTINSSATTMTVASTSNFDVSGSIKVDDEVVYYTSKNATQFLGLVRGAGGTVAAAHTAGKTIFAPILSVHHNTLAEAVIATQTKVGAGDSSPTLNRVLVGTSDGTSSWQDEPAINCINCTNLPGGGGDVVGPSSAVDERIAVYEGTTGKLIKDGGVVIAGLQPVDSDLSAIAALLPSNDDIIQRKGGVWTSRTMVQVKTDLGLTKPDVGLANADNTSDASKPVSTAQQTALDLKADIASPALTGTPAAPTAAAGTNTTQIATTAHVFAERSNEATLTNKTLTSPVINTPTGIAFSDISGSISDAQVPNNITVDLATTATTATSGDSATAFFSSGTIDTARLGSGTADSTTFLRGDNTWQTVSGGGITNSAGSGVMPYTVDGAGNLAGSPLTRTSATVITSTASIQVSLNGTAADPALTVGTANKAGLYASSGALAVTNAIGQPIWFPADKTGNGFGLSIASNGCFTWSNTTGDASAANDLLLCRDAANTLAQRNGANAQTFNLYNTFTDAGNYERVYFQWDANYFNISTAAAGTGTLRNITLNAEGIYVKTQGSNRWVFDNQGHFIAASDNLYDIGASGTGRPRTIYAATSVVVAGTGYDTTAAVKFGAGGQLFSNGATVAGIGVTPVVGAGHLYLTNGGNTPVDFLLNTSTPGMTFVNVGLQQTTTNGVMEVNNGTLGGPGWLRQNAGRCYLTANQTNATATMADLTGCSVTVTSGRKYQGTLTLYVNDSVAAEGVKLDFDGGTATATNFRAHATGWDTTLTINQQTAALATDVTAATFTGDGMIKITFTFEPSATGTFIPRVAQNSHSAGTLTVYRGSELTMEDMP